jgi:Gpi18-like mannosyltransferase
MIIDATDAQKRLFRHPGIQMIILICMFFVSTRNAMVSVLLAAAYVVFVYILANEYHPYNILPKNWLESSGTGKLSSQSNTLENYKNNLQKLYAN